MLVNVLFSSCKILRIISKDIFLDILFVNDIFSSVVKQKYSLGIQYSGRDQSEKTHKKIFFYEIDIRFKNTIIYA